MAPFNSASFPDSLAIAKEDSLTLGTIDAIQKLHIRSVPLGEQPRRLALQEATRSLAVVTAGLLGGMGEARGAGGGGGSRRHTCVAPRTAPRLCSRLVAQRAAVWLHSACRRHSPVLPCSLLTPALPPPNPHTHSPLGRARGPRPGDRV